MIDIEQSEEQLLNKAFNNLWSIFRSIIGTEASLDYLPSYMPLTIEKVPSGTKVLDWKAHPEWKINRGRLWAPDNTLICDAEVNNLHIINYSEPVSEIFTLNDDIVDHYLDGKFQQNPPSLYRQF